MATTPPTQSNFPELTIVNGKHITLVPMDQLLEVAYSIGVELKRRAIIQHHEPLVSLSMRLSGIALVDAVKHIDDAARIIANRDFSQWSRSRSARGH